MTDIFLGLDVGKTTHHATALTTAGKEIWDNPHPPTIEPGESSYFAIFECTNV